MNLAAALKIASGQHGAIGCRQLDEVGLSWRERQTAITSGLLDVVTPGVVVVAGSPDTWYRRLQVCLLALGDYAWVSHESAATLLGLDGSDSKVHEFTVPRSKRARIPYGAIVHTTGVIGAHDVLREHGFRCASATRTVLDLAAAGAKPDRVAAAIDSAIRLRLSAPLVLTERLAALRGRGRYGVRMLDQLLLDTGGESVLERRFLRLVRQAGLPRPETQRRIRSDSRHVARVDFLYGDHLMVIEVSGRLGHSNPADRERDAQRRNELQDLGYRVFEYTWGDLTRRPGYVVDTLASRLAASAT